MRRVLLAATVMWLLVMISLAAPRRVGDASEYVAMAGRLADLGAPTFSAADMAAFTTAWATTDTGFELQTRQLPELQGRDGRWDMPHMWLYPLLSVPFVWGTRLMGAGDPWGLVALNVTMVAALLWLAARRGAGPWTLTLVASPLVWWLDKPLADLLIACAVGGATLLWPHPASIVLLGLAAAQNPALAVVAVVFTVAAVVAEPSRLRSRVWIAGVVVGVACASTAPAYYFWRLGRFSPLTLWTGTVYWPTLATLLFPMLDVNMGVVPRFPPGAVTVLAALAGRRGWRSAAAFPAALSAPLLLLVVSQQSNQNQGGSPDLSRYCLWLWPLALPWLMAMDAMTTRLARAAGAALLVLGMAWSTIAFLPTRPESYRYPTPLATWLWQRHPAWTSPTIEAFAERTSHREPGDVPTATPGCEKVLLHGGSWPVSCPPTIAAPEPCRSSGLYCYANRTTEGSYVFDVVGREPVPAATVHDRTWPRPDAVSTWVATRVGRARAGESEVAVAHLRAVFGLAWRQPWTAEDGSLVLYARDVSDGARLALRHARPVRITVATPEGDVSNVRATPGEAPTMVALPKGAHVLVDVRNDEGRP
jgi:hypothetical protein